MIIRKWYFDNVTREGALIRYRTAITWKGLTLGHTETLHRDGTHAREVFVGEPKMPYVERDQLHWPVEVRTKAAAQSSPTLTGGYGHATHRQQILWQDGSNALTWDPVLINGTDKTSKPLSEFEIGSRCYAECLQMNFAPWHLGLSRLDWGRFCGEANSLVWIRWTGKHNRSWVWFDGELDSDLKLDQQQVACRSACLRIDHPKVFLDEHFLSGALGQLPWPRSIRMTQFLNGHQTKYWSRAELVTDGIVDQGYALWEVVTWP